MRVQFSPGQQNHTKMNAKKQCACCEQYVNTPCSTVADTKHCPLRLQYANNTNVAVSGTNVQSNN